MPRKIGPNDPVEDVVPVMGSERPAPTPSDTPPIVADVAVQADVGNGQLRALDDFSSLPPPQAPTTSAPTSAPPTRSIPPLLSLCIRRFPRVYTQHLWTMNGDIMEVFAIKSARCQFVVSFWPPPKQRFAGDCMSEGYNIALQHLPWGSFVFARVEGLLQSDHRRQHLHNLCAILFHLVG